MANGAEFTAVEIVPNLSLEEYVVDDGVSIFFGPPDGILLQSDALKDVQIANLPPSTILLGPEWKPRPKQGISRQGLPCVPGFVLTDYKSQSRTMVRVLLGLYGRRVTKAGQRRNDGGGRVRNP